MQPIRFREFLYCIDDRVGIVKGRNLTHAIDQAIIEAFGMRIVRSDLFYHIELTDGESYYSRYVRFRSGKPYEVVDRREGE